MCAVSTGKIKYLPKTIDVISELDSKLEPHPLSLLVIWLRDSHLMDSLLSDPGQNQNLKMYIFMSLITSSEDLHFCMSVETDRHL